MHLIIEAAIKTLQKTSFLLSKLSDTHLSDTTIPPYFSSIGSHIRHILDFYDSIFNSKNGQIDLTDRKRDSEVESSTEKLSHYLDSVIERLKAYDIENYRKLIILDDLGLGKVEIEYTNASILAHAISHTIHHYAIINYILNGLNISLKDNSFGYNPTTPIKINS